MRELEVGSLNYQPKQLPMQSGLEVPTHRLGACVVRGLPSARRQFVKWKQEVGS